VRADSTAPRPIVPLLFRVLPGLPWAWNLLPMRVVLMCRALRGLQNVCGFGHVPLEQPCKAFEFKQASVTAGGVCCVLPALYWSGSSSQPDHLAREPACTPALFGMLQHRTQGC
jgi:hypothetical protein